jgi:MFS family permease
VISNVVSDKGLCAPYANSTSAPANDRLRRAVQATYVAFLASGFAFASWASRIPQVRRHFHLQPSVLGLVLLTIAAGSIISSSLSGPLVSWLGPRRAISSTAVLLGAALAIIAAGYLVGLAIVVIGLFVFGMASGTWDLAMNVHGGTVEGHLGRSIMPRFHAAWSLGTVGGALVGAVAVAVHLPVTAHLAAVAVVVALAVLQAARFFLPSQYRPAESGAPRVNDHHEDGHDHRKVLRAWLEPRTLAIGAFALAFAFAEGTANDWSSLAAIDGYHLPAALATLVLATFLAAMTIGRWFSPSFVDRHGRVPVTRLLGLVAILGVLLFVFGPVVPFAFVGALLWGAGTSVGFPLAVSAGGDEPAMAPGRVSVIASVGYCAFFAGPPLVGFLADQLTILRALICVAALLAIAMVLAILATSGLLRAAAHRATTPRKDGTSTPTACARHCYGFTAITTASRCTSQRTERVTPMSSVQTVGSMTLAGSNISALIWSRPTRQLLAGSTSAVISCGRYWIISSGAMGILSASASYTSILRPSGVSRSRVPASWLKWRS